MMNRVEQNEEWIVQRTWYLTLESVVSVSGNVSIKPHPSRGSLNRLCCCRMSVGNLHPESRDSSHLGMICA